MIGVYLNCALPSLNSNVVSKYSWERELPGKQVNPSLCSYLTVHVSLDCLSVVLD